MNTWLIFLEYAKQHPHAIPKKMKQRAAVYHKFIDSCKCGAKHEVCNILGVTKVTSGSHKINDDPEILKAKIRAYESIVKDKDEYIEALESYIKKHNKLKRTSSV